MKLLKIITPIILLVSSSIEASADTSIVQRPSELKTDLREHIGKTFLHTLLTPIVGIDAEIDNDIYSPVTIKEPQDIADFAENHFDSRVTTRLYRFFKDGRNGFEETISHFSGKPVVPGQLREELRPIASALAANQNAAGRATGASTALALLLSGSGTLVILDDKNYFYNVGYQDPNVTTGRSFAVSGERKMLDATHRDFLKDLKLALSAPTYEVDQFYKVLFKILTATDSRNLSNLDSQAQIVVADFLSVYTAELERHEMADLGLSSPWGIDFAQVTLLAEYTQLAKMVMKYDRNKGEYKFESGDVEDYIKGSIGNSKSQFTKLSRLITAFMSAPTNQPKLIDKLVELTPITDISLAKELRGDIFRRVLFFLNNKQHVDLAYANGGEITRLLVELMGHIRLSENEVTKHVSDCVSGIKKFGCY